MVRDRDRARRAPLGQGATLLPSTRAVCVAMAFTPPCAALRPPTAHARRHDDVEEVVVMMGVQQSLYKYILGQL